MSEVPQRLLPLVEPAAQLVCTQQVTQSYLGGAPQVPKHFKWPCRANGHTIGFLGQLNLAELAHTPHWLPATGWLLFFYDTDLFYEGVHDPAPWVHYLDAAESLCERERPGDAEPDFDLQKTHVSKPEHCRPCPVGRRAASRLWASPRLKRRTLILCVKVPMVMIPVTSWVA